MLDFDDTGSGDPLVLIHGWGTSRMIWQSVRPLLGDRRVIAIDVPGFGRSPAAGPGFELEEVARAIWRGLPEQGPVTLVGHSLGGALALMASTLEPARTSRLVLCAPAGLQPKPAFAAAAVAPLGALTTGLRRQVTPLASTQWGRRVLLGATTLGDSVSQDDVVEMAMASAGATRLARSLQAVVAADLRPLLVQAPRELGVLFGTHDRVIRPATADVIRAARPDAVFELLPRTGHVPMMERPQAFAAVLRQLLTRLDDVHTLATPRP
ncbi:MAG: alpha/beta fold hydrolase [Solirubrobacteraceae bacterium]|nr:alpha/beta fold hydrolase [Solirubrobacteraceae bacterium]